MKDQITWSLTQFWALVYHFYTNIVDIFMMTSGKSKKSTMFDYNPQTKYPVIIIFGTRAWIKIALRLFIFFLENFVMGVKKWPKLWEFVLRGNNCPTEHPMIIIFGTPV